MPVTRQPARPFHQTKDGFEANRAAYETDLKTPMGDLVEDLTAAFAKAKVPLKGDRKASLFRIHLGVRFSKNKAAYKTNAGAVSMQIGGSKTEPETLAKLDKAGLAPSPRTRCRY